MELLQNWRDVLMSSHTSDQTRRGVLDGLYASEQVVGDAVQKRIAVVHAVRDKRLDQSLSSIHRQRPDNRTQLPKLKKLGTANGADLYVVCCMSHDSGLAVTFVTLVTLILF